MHFKKCPVCGGEVIEKEVEKLSRGGQHTYTGPIKCLQRASEIRLTKNHIVAIFGPK
jgi:hypothetical protein